VLCPEEAIKSNELVYNGYGRITIGLFGTGAPKKLTKNFPCYYRSQQEKQLGVFKYFLLAVRCKTTQQFVLGTKISLILRLVH
jgi:hypothetical protein